MPSLNTNIGDIETSDDEPVFDGTGVWVGPNVGSAFLTSGSTADDFPFDTAAGWLEQYAHPSDIQASLGRTALMAESHT